jgi:hypothetical protein
MAIECRLREEILTIDLKREVMIASASGHDHEPQNFHNCSSGVISSLADEFASATGGSPFGPDETRYATRFE